MQRQRFVQLPSAGPGAPPSYVAATRDEKAFDEETLDEENEKVLTQRERAPPKHTGLFSLWSWRAQEQQHDPEKLTDARPIRLFAPVRPLYFPLINI